MVMDSNSSSSREKKKKELYNALMKEDWKEVVKIFKGHPEIHATKIAQMVPRKEKPDENDDKYESDTALHWAITYKAEESTVAELVSTIKTAHSSGDDDDDDVDNKKASEILKCKNKLGNTPLHCAAIQGSSRICKHITDVSPPLVLERNNVGETPLFLAALNGHKSTFLLLYSISKDHASTLPPSIWQRNNGDTLLHCAIRRKHFYLSYEIIQLFKDENIGIGSYFNKNGKLPLDEIVSIPSAFENGIYKRRRERWCSCFYLGRSHSDDDQSKSCFSSVFHGKMKEKHMLCERIMEELVQQDPWYKKKDHAKEVQDIENNKYYHEKDMEIQGGRIKISTALLIAAKNGLIKQVKKILDDIPVSVHDKSLKEKKNIVHVAIEERQSLVLEEVKKRKHWLVLREKLDADGNNALHLAAKQSKYTASGIRGSVMQMQWEIMWFEYVKECMPAYFIYQHNNNGETPVEIFAKEHMDLINDCHASVKDMCGSYMVAATLITGSAFSACLQGIHSYDHTFSVSILISFLFSITSLSTFLAIYVSRKEPTKGFRRSLPLKLSLGIISFFASLISMLVSFYSALSFDFNPKDKYKPIISYGVILLPVVLIYTFTQVPLHWHVLVASFKKVPNPRIVGEENISRFFHDSRMGQHEYLKPSRTTTI